MKRLPDTIDLLREAVKLIREQKTNQAIAMITIVQAQLFELEEVLLRIAE